MKKTRITDKRQSRGLTWCGYMALWCVIGPVWALTTPDPEHGKSLATACVACHGQDGNSATPFPKLAGQHAPYTLKQLQDFQANQSRKNAVMMSFVQTLNAQDMADLAAFYAAQSATIGVSAPEHVESGQRIYRAGVPEQGVPACSACHGPEGLGSPLAGFPRLSGQHAAYVLEQLQAFRSGARANDARGMMRLVAHNLTDEDMRAVASYVEGLHR